jgi:hypothetical protein
MTIPGRQRARKPLCVFGRAAFLKTDVLMNFDLKSVWEQLIGRFGGPLHFRFLMQPLMGIFLGIHAGIRDARAGKPPYAFMLRDPGKRKEAMREGWKHIGRLFILAAVIDVIYEIIEFRHVYPLQPLIVAGCMAVIPYLLVRGPTNRIARRWFRRKGKLPAATGFSTPSGDTDRTSAEAERKKRLHDKAS